MFGLPLISFSSEETILGYDDGLLTQTLQRGNIFFSTWICLIVSVLLVLCWFRASIITSDWVLLGVASAALFISSLIYFSEDITTEGEDGSLVTSPQCTNPTEIVASSCQKVTIAFLLGLISCIISFIMAALYCLGPKWHLLIITPLFVLWGVAVAYITFSTAAGAS
jgi:hypothetical protein